MAEYIDKKRVVYELIRIAAQVSDSKTRIVAKCINAVELMPAADVVRVQHGHWFDIGSLSCRCSMCGCKNDRVRPYCPVCGAKMKEADNAQNND